MRKGIKPFLGVCAFCLCAFPLTHADAKTIVGEKEYSDLNTAIKEIGAQEATFKITEDETTAMSISIPAGANYTIDGGNNKVSYSFNLDAKSSENTTLNIKNIIMDGQNSLGMAINSQNQNTKPNELTLSVVDSSIMNYKNKGLYLTNIKKLLVDNVKFNELATTEQNWYQGDYALDINLIGVTDADITIKNSTFAGKSGGNSPIKVTQRGGIDDINTDIPYYVQGHKNTPATIKSLLVENCDFTKVTGNSKGDVIIGSSPNADGTARTSATKYNYKLIKANNDEDINIENFEKTKRIIQDRLESIVGYEYNIRMNTITGELVVELPDDDNIELEESLITTIGKFEIIDSQTGIILMNNSDLKSADVLTSTANSGYQAYLHLRFNDSGTEKLKEISKEYVTTTDAAGTETTKNVTARLDGQDIITTYFGEEITNGEMQIPMGDLVTDYSQYLDNESRIARVADIISSETMPLAYQLSSDNYIKSSITDNIKLIAEIAFAVIILIVTIYMTIKFKLKKGFKKAIFDIGYIAILLLVLRYTNVNITLNSLIAFIAVIAINYVFSIKLLSAGNDSKAVFANTIKELYLMIIPVCIIAIIFTFMSSLVISSVGMVLFWGLFIQAVYNALLILVLDVV